MDLTFSDLAAALPTGSVLVLQDTDSVPSDGIYIQVGAVTGDEIRSLSDLGVVEFILKLLLAASDAQSLFNENRPVGQRIQSFPPPSYGQTSRSSDGRITTRIISQMVAVLDVSTETAVAPLI